MHGTIKSVRMTDFPLARPLNRRGREKCRALLFKTRRPNHDGVVAVSDASKCFREFGVNLNAGFLCDLSVWDDSSDLRALSFAGREVGQVATGLNWHRKRLATVFDGEKPEELDSSVPAESRWNATWSKRLL